MESLYSMEEVRTRLQMCVDKIVNTGRDWDWERENWEYDYSRHVGREFYALEHKNFWLGSRDENETWFANDGMGGPSSVRLTVKYVLATSWTEEKHKKQMGDKWEKWGPVKIEQVGE